MKTMLFKRKTSWVLFILFSAALVEVSGCPDTCWCNIQGSTVKIWCPGGMDLETFPWTWPENVTELDLSSNQLKNLPRGIFDANTELVKLLLYNNQLKNLTPGIFDNNTKLKSLSLSRNQLKDLPSGIFDKNKELKYLFLYKNQLKDLPPGIFDTNSELDYLDLSSNQLKDLPAGIFDTNTELKDLFLFNNQLKDLTPGIFDNNTKLAKLSLSRNQLKDLPPGIFDTNTKLKYLFLYKNQLNNLPPGIFDTNSELEYLYLSGNQLEDLPPGIFDTNTELIKLLLFDNQLKNLTPGIFDNNTKLANLNLFGNQLNNFPPGIFDNNTELTNLSLSINQLKDLPHDIFDKNTKLVELDLGSNQLKDLPHDIFDTNTKLAELYLIGNQLKDLPPGILDTNTELKHLDLGSNQLKDLPPGIFNNNKELQTLDLSSNQLKDLPPGIFNNNTELKNLYLYENQLKNVSSGIFDKNTKLEHLLLFQNQLKNVPSGIFDKNRKLTYLGLSDNQIKVLPEGILQNLSMLFYFNMANNRLKNITAGHFSNKENLQYLFLQNNSINCIPNDAFINLPKLEYLLLSDNPITSISPGAFGIPNERLSIFMIRTELKTLSLRSFTDEFSNMTADISVEDGQIGTLTVLGANGKERCFIQLGLGKAESVLVKPNTEDIFLESRFEMAFRRAGFARKGRRPGYLGPCPTGTFVNVSVAIFSEPQCLECPAGGFYSDTEAYVSDSCQKCPIGTFVHYKKAPGKRKRDCLACPQGTNTDTFAGHRACKCLSGFYRTHRFEGCSECDQAGLKCINDYTTLESGYWWRWRNKTYKLLYEQYIKNLVGDTPVAGINSSNGNHSFSNGTLIEYRYMLPKPHQCPRNESCEGGLDAKCVDGFEGPLCEVCSKGYYKQLQTCQKCPTTNWMAGQISIAAVVIAIIIALIVWSSKRKSKKNTGRSSVDIILGRLKIAIGFYQVTFGLIETFSYINWPDSLELIGKYSEYLQLNLLQIAPIHCLFPDLKVDAFGSLFTILAINAAVIITSLVIFGLRKFILMGSGSDERDKEAKMSEAKELIYRSLFFILYVTYLSTCSKTASVLPLACRELCDDDDEKDCQKFLKADYSIKCHDPRYNRLVIVAYCAVTYIIFLPAAALIILWKRRKVSEGSPPENGRPDGKENKTEVVTGLRFLFENYNSKSWYWEAVEMGRKVLLTSGLILVGGESRAYIGLACVMSGLYGMFFAYVHPIADPFENKLMLSSLAVTFVNLGIGAVSKIPKENIPASIDAYMDNILFKILVIASNSLVIGLLVVQYLKIVYRFLKDWRKNPQWSLSCCLAMLLPLNELQGELRGLVGKSVISKQLQTGKVNMPSISNTFKDTGVIEFTLEETDETNVEETKTSDKEASGNSEVNQTSKRKASRVHPENSESIAEIMIHAPPKDTYETSF